MNFRKWNNLIGWLVCIVACIVYILTAEATGSFWDTGEFIASAYKLQLPHPPGAPLFTLLGRFFIVLFGGDNPAFAVNIMSAVASGFTILFLFWTITHFARKLVVGTIEEPDVPQTWTIMAGGVVGALAYTFTDSFWFSAVEGEVYALSSFFTALVFWAMLKWERADDLAGNDTVLRGRADRWIVFIFFMMGLSVGVHLLNLLTIPALVMVYYYKRYNYTRKGAIWAFIIGCVITGFIQVAIIQYTMKAAGAFDLFAVNTLGLPFFSGFALYFILLAILIVIGLRFKETTFNQNTITTWFVIFLLLILLPFLTQTEFGIKTIGKLILIVGLGLVALWAKRNSLQFVKLGLWCFVFMMIGYSMYITTLQRSNANPAIDMNNVDNPMSLVYYLGREQYGTQPLLYGPHFQAAYERDETGNVVLKDGEMKYTKGKDSYVPIGRSQDPEYKSSDKQLFVRVWDRSNDQGHADFYADWLGLERTQNPETGESSYEAPSYADNINWFFTYQMAHMYWRYFMWNFAGKQNDIQGFGNKRDGNWLSGISPIDNSRLGDQSRMPESLKDNKANNKLYLLPFVLGMLGCVYQFMRNRRDWVVSFLLFFFTGIAIVLYLNQAGNQPRERDYAFVGSFYAFAIWIGLSVPALVRLAREREDKSLFKNVVTYGSLATLILSFFINIHGGSLLSTIALPLVFAAFTAIYYYAVRAVGANSWKGAVGVAFLLCMIAPAIMAKEEWDDHDRSKKTLAPSMARNYLESCAPNAILFTFGDNDTYPLWYAQEVEGVRPDIRIINTSLLGIDWYVNQLRYKLNASDPIDVIWTPDQVSGLAYITFRPQGTQEPRPLYDVMKNEIGPMLNAEDKTSLQATFPVKKFLINVDAATLGKYGVVNAADSVYTQMQIDLPDTKNYLTLDQLTILNIIAANGWKRPIYFTSPYGELGFGQYLRKDGLSYRLVPVKNSFPQQKWLVDQALRGTSIRDNNIDVMRKNLMEKFTSGGAKISGVYFDEENRRHLLSIRSVFGELAGNMADAGRQSEAVQVLNKSEELISTKNLPYAMASRYNSHNQTALIYLEAAYKAGDKTLAAKIKTAIRKDVLNQKAYYDYLKADKEAYFNTLIREAEINEFMIQLVDALEKQYETQAVQVPENPSGTDSSQRR